MAFLQQRDPAVEQNGTREQALNEKAETWPAGGERCEQSLQSAPVGSVRYLQRFGNV